MRADALITQRLAETSNTSAYAKKGAYKGKVPSSEMHPVSDPETSPSTLSAYAKKGTYKGKGRGPSMKKESY
jgi:hypothetical protein